MSGEAACNRGVTGGIVRRDTLFPLPNRGLTTRPPFAWAAPHLLVPQYRGAMFSALLLLLVPTAAAASPPALPGDLIITEFMAEPDTVANYWGEWFEVYNNSGRELELLNLEVRTEDEPGFVVGTSLVVPAGAYLVFGIDGNTSRNGGVTVDYVYGDGTGLGIFALDHRGDAIRLVYGTTTIDAVEWDSSSGWNLEVEDSSYQVSANALTLEWANDLAHNWCDSDIPFGGLYATPGSANSNCDGFGRDDDGDGFTPAMGDCDDQDAYVNPDAVDGARDPFGEPNDDADCDGVRDDGAIDDDLDGYAEVDGDCDDTDPDLSPGLAEVDDGLDNDCNACVDDLDDDLDGFTECPADVRTDGEGFDCDDSPGTGAAINPDAAEVPYDTIDQDCDGEDACDLDNDGFYASPDQCVDGLACCEQNGAPGLDCEDTNASVNPDASEGDPAAGDVPDQADNDCNGVVDDPFLDLDGDGVTVLEGDCRDASPTEDALAAEVFPGAPELCGDHIDNDCDGLIDDRCEETLDYARIGGGGLCSSLGFGGSLLGAFTGLLAALRRRNG